MGAKVLPVSPGAEVANSLSSQTSPFGSNQQAVSTEGGSANSTSVLNSSRLSEQQLAETQRAVWSSGTC